MFIWVPLFIGPRFTISFSFLFFFTRNGEIQVFEGEGWGGVDRWRKGQDSNLATLSLSPGLKLESIRKVVRLRIIKVTMLYRNNIIEVPPLLAKTAGTTTIQPPPWCHHATKKKPPSPPPSLQRHSLQFAIFQHHILLPSHHQQQIKSLSSLSSFVPSFAFWKEPLPHLIICSSHYHHQQNYYQPHFFKYIKVLEHSPKSTSNNPSPNPNEKRWPKWGFLLWINHKCLVPTRSWPTKKFQTFEGITVFHIIVGRKKRLI